MTKKNTTGISIKNLDKKEVGQRLKLIRKALGHKQKEFSKSLTISAASLSDIESGKNVPRHDVIYNLYTKYNVNINYLLHGEGEMFRTDFVKQALDSGIFGNNTEFLKDFLRYFNESPLVRYEIMGFFRELLLEKEKIIEKDLRAYEKEQEEKKHNRKEKIRR